MSVSCSSWVNSGSPNHPPIHVAETFFSRVSLAQMHISSSTSLTRAWSSINLMCFCVCLCPAQRHHYSIVKIGMTCCPTPCLPVPATFMLVLCFNSSLAQPPSPLSSSPCCPCFFGLSLGGQCLYMNRREIGAAFVKVLSRPILDCVLCCLPCEWSASQIRCGFRGLHVNGYC